MLKRTGTRKERKSWVISLSFLVIVYLLGQILDPYNQSQLNVVLVYFIAILSLVILTGYSGQISLGQGALMAIGGYVCAISITKFLVPSLLAIALAVLGSLLAGLILGLSAARLSGPYLAGATLVVSLAIPSLAIRFESVLAGDVGIPLYLSEPPTWLTSILGTIDFEEWNYIFTLPFAALVLYFVINLTRSKYGRDWAAVRDRPIAAALSGINVERTRIYVFVLSSGIAGLAGALYGFRGIVGPSVYPTALSLALLTGAVIGGVRHISGALIGAVLVVFLPDLINSLSNRFALSQNVSDYLPAFIGAILLILTVILNPSGIAGGAHHHRAHPHK